MISLTGKKSLRAKTNGFTLLELLIVMAIIALLLLSAIPSFKGTYKTLEIFTASKKIASFITYARQRAILERVKYRLNFDYAARKYWLTREKDPIDYPNYYVEIKNRFAQLPEKVVLDPEVDFITFLPDGQSNINLLTLRNEFGDEYILYLGKGVNYVKISKKTTD